jgi:predicted DNA-binding transcriptional regulator AlpA
MVKQKVNAIDPAYELVPTSQLSRERHITQKTLWSRRQKDPSFPKPRKALNGRLAWLRSELIEYDRLTLHAVD